MRSLLTVTLTLFALGLGACGSDIDPSQQENASQSASFALASQPDSTESAATSRAGKAAALRLSNQTSLDEATERLGLPPEAAAGKCCYGRCSNNGRYWTAWEYLGKPKYGHCGDRAIGYCDGWVYADAKWDGC